MILVVHKRPSPVKYQARYRVRLDAKRAKGPHLDECLSKLNVGDWFGVVDAALIATQERRPRSRVITISITTE